MKETCHQRFRKITKIMKFCANFVGADITDPNYEMSWITYFVIIATLSFFGCTGYTIYIGSFINGDWTIILQALSMAGSGVEGLTKYYCCFRYCKIMCALQQFLDGIYRDFEKKHSEYRRFLTKRSDIIYKLIMCFMGLYIFGVIGLVSFPFIYWIFYNKKIFVMQFLLPGIDPTSFYGYLIHQGAHLMLLSFGAFGNFAGDMYLFVYILNIPLIKDLIHVKFMDLNKVIIETHDTKQTKPLLDDIIDWHHKYLGLIQKTEKIFFPVVFVTVFLKCFSIVSTLFCIFIKVWPAAGAYLVLSIVLLYAYCALGTIVEISNDDLCDSIYNDCIWYELTVPEQKMIIYMLHKSQNCRNLTVGSIMPLSMNTGLQLTKAIYSYSMISFVLSYNSALYCSDHICPGDDIHVACRRGRGRLRSSVRSHCLYDVEKIPMTEKLKTQIIQEINSIRDRIAKGSMPGFFPAVHMLTVSWDKELEKLAALHVMRCENKNDECRNTKDFHHVGQISTVAITVNKTWEPHEFVTHIFKTWTNHSNACDSNTMDSFQLTTETQDCRSFAQLAQEHNSHIGCSLLAAHENSMTKTFATCNFARGNIKGQRVYKAGQSAIACKMGINSFYRYLCSEKERLDIND